MKVLLGLWISRVTWAESSSPESTSSSRIPQVRVDLDLQHGGRDGDLLAHLTIFSSFFRAATTLVRNLISALRALISSRTQSCASLKAALNPGVPRPNCFCSAAT